VLPRCWGWTPMNDPFAPIASAASSGSSGKKSNTWRALLPVPEDAPAAPRQHPELGKPTFIWLYDNDAGQLLGYTHRYDTDKGKEFRPLTFATRGDGSGKAEWRWQSWAPKRPLYGLRELALRPDAPVLVTEGEKACDAARELLPRMVVVTSPNGSESAAKADWSPLRGRDVTVWPDADDHGLAYATTVARLAISCGATSAKVIEPPPGVVKGWDAANALAEGWKQARAHSLVASSRAAQERGSAPVSAKPLSETAATKGRRRATPQRDVLIGITETECVELWHDPAGEAYATFPVNSHRESWPLRSREFKRWLSGRSYDRTGSPHGSQALEDALRILDMRAAERGAEYEPFLRIGSAGDKLYLDLCNKSWEVVEISAHDWQVIHNAPIKLMRSASMKPLPTPEAGYSIDELRGFLNVKTDQDFQLVVGWLVAALRHKGPFPVLTINGEQGTGKSTFAQMLRLLIDPSVALIRAAPKDDHNLNVSAGNSWVLAFDNLSSVPGWLSDGFCRLATGAGFATRSHYENTKETIFQAQRPIILNGIPLLTERADLADRALAIQLRRLTDKEYRPEDEFWAAFEESRPRILGALLDAVSVALRRISAVKLPRVPRMADFAKWVTAAEWGLGWEDGTILKAYDENRRNTRQDTFAADNVAVAIHAFVLERAPRGWEGTPTELFETLNGYVTESTRKAPSWPKTPQALGNRLERAAPLLRDEKGFVVDRRNGVRRLIIIMPPGKP